MSEMSQSVLQRWDEDCLNQIQKILSNCCVKSK